MKRHLILFGLTVLAITGTLHAQQGSIYLGGSAGFSSSKTKFEGSGNEGTTSSWRFSPEIGTFVSNNQSVGVVLGLSGSKFSDDSKFSTSSVLLYTRRFFKMGEKFSLFTGLYAGYLGSKSEDDNTPDVKGSGFQALIDLGGAFALSDRFTIVGRYGALSFSSVSNKIDGDKVSTSTDFDLGVNTYGPAFTIGLYYTIKQ